MTRSSSYSSMPGAFVQNDYPTGPKSHFFQPPRTPSASSSVYMTRSTISNMSTGSDKTTTTGRKRSRQEFNVDNNITPQSMMSDWTLGMNTADSMARSDMMDPGSPFPFVSTKYQILGGLDTPSAVQAALGEESEYSDVNYRKRLSGTTQDDHDDAPSYFPKITAEKLTDSNGRPRLSTNLEPHDDAPHKDAFGKALGVVGEVVSKMWDFCTAGAFRGFYAGGGRSYTVDSEVNSNLLQPILSTGQSLWQDEGRGGKGRTHMVHKETTQVPGGFPEDNFTCHRDSTRPRAAKRRITGMEASNDDLTRNWVMVPAARSATTTSTSKPITPLGSPRPSARYTMPTASSANRRPVGAASKPASRASAGAGPRAGGFRRPALTNSRPSVSHAGSPGLNTKRPASYASPHSLGGSKVETRVSTPVRNGNIAAPNGVIPSPISIEAQKWAEKLRKDEEETDESMRRFNAQLKAMIREGKEALGTKVDVDLQDVDDDMGAVEGFETVGRWK